MGRPPKKVAGVTGAAAGTGAGITMRFVEEEQAKILPPWRTARDATQRRGSASTYEGDQKKHCYRSTSGRLGSPAVIHLIGDRRTISRMGNPAKFPQFLQLTGCPYGK